LCGIVHGIRPRVFPPIKANLRYRFCYHYFKSHSSLLRSSLRILEKVALDLADSRATGFSEDSTKTVFRFRLQHVALCCIGVTPEGGRVQESKNGRAKLDANLAGLGGLRTRGGIRQRPLMRIFSFQTTWALEPRMRMAPKSRAANFLSSDSASGPAECLRGSARYVLI
jgi:hypothetical protein